LTVSCEQCDQRCVDCESKTICISCDITIFRYLSPVSRFCECSYGYIQDPNNQMVCLACIVGCSNCINMTTCASCLAGYFYVNSTFCATMCNNNQKYNYKSNSCDDYISSGNSNIKGRFEFSFTYLYQQN
jgi:hypothetical protein